MPFRKRCCGHRRRLSVREDEASKLLADSILPIDSYDPTRLDKGRPDLSKQLPGGYSSVCRLAVAPSTIKW